MEVSMPICPECGKESKKLIDKSCPECNIFLYEYEKRWYIRNPIKEMMNAYSGWMTAKLSADKDYEVVHRFKTKGLTYKYEVARTKQLFKEAGYDLEIALAAITLLFWDKKYSWRINGSMQDLVPMFHVAVTIVKAKIVYKKALKERTSVLDDMIEERNRILNG